MQETESVADVAGLRTATLPVVAGDFDGNGEGADDVLLSRRGSDPQIIVHFTGQPALPQLRVPVLPARVVCQLGRSKDPCSSATSMGATARMFCGRSTREGRRMRTWRRPMGAGASRTVGGTRSEGEVRSVTSGISTGPEGTTCSGTTPTGTRSCGGGGLP